MASTKRFSLASSLLSISSGVPTRLRKKLQKKASKQRKEPAKRLGFGATNESRESIFDGAKVILDRQLQAKPSLPAPRDVRRSGYQRARDSSAQSTGSPSIAVVPPADIIPELSHLGQGDARSRGSDSTVPCAASTARRRRAKTPVSFIGQLEGLLQEEEDFHAPRGTSSVELLAEQYRALLKSRMSILKSRQGERDVDETRHGTRDEEESSSMENRPGSPLGSPTSEDETLVSFDEETVYFKPVSFSPEPPSPAQNYGFPNLATSATPRNLSLQICLDLLTRELSSAATEGPQRSGTEAAALQIWVMIEAYEKLRDQLHESRLGPDEALPLEMMFDMWLRALYTIHDSLMTDARTSESDYEAQNGNGLH